MDKKNTFYIYHMVPDQMYGNILYPLNTLKGKYPEIYEREVGKYVGREHITQQRIPILDCLWSDVLHFSAVDPKEIKQALIDAGRNTDFSISYYKVDPKLIEPKNAVIYLYIHADTKDKMNKKNFIPYNPDEMANFSLMPQATKDYYKKTIDKGERPLLYHKIPHILYKGTIVTTDLPIISV